jgi:microcystin-dependent protein
LGGNTVAGGGSFNINATTQSSASNTTGITITNANAGSGNPHAIIQPTIVCNYIIRII